MNSWICTCQLFITFDFYGWMKTIKLKSRTNPQNQLRCSQLDPTVRIEFDFQLTSLSMLCIFNIFCFVRIWRSIRIWRIGWKTRVLKSSYNVNLSLLQRKLKSWFCLLELHKIYLRSSKIKNARFAESRFWKVEILGCMMKNLHFCKIMRFSESRILCN